MKKLILILLLISSVFADADYKQAFKLYQSQKYKQAMPLFKSSKNPMSLFYIGAMFEKGFGVKKNLETAKKYYKYATNKFGIKEARHNYAHILFLQKKYKEAYKEFLKNDDYFLSQYFLGKMLYYGISVEKNEGDALYYLSMSSEKNYDLSIILLAKIYLYDKNEPKKAKKLLEKLVTGKNMFDRNLVNTYYLYAKALNKDSETQKQALYIFKKLCDNKKTSVSLEACVDYNFNEYIDNEDTESINKLIKYANTNNVYAITTLLQVYFFEENCEDSKKILDKLEYIMKNRKDYIFNASALNSYTTKYQEICE